MGSRSLDASDSETSEKTEKPNSEISMKIENPNQVQIMYNGKIVPLSRMLQENEELRQAFLEETRKLRRISNEHTKRIFEQVRALENKKRQLDSWSKELNQREELLECERQKLQEEKTKLVQLAQKIKSKRTKKRRLIEEENQRQDEDDERTKKRRLIEEENQRQDEDEKIEKEAVWKQTKQLQKKQEDLDNDLAIWQKIDTMSEQWQVSFKKLILGLANLLNYRFVDIGIERMGVDEKVFKACKITVQQTEFLYFMDDSIELCPLWLEKLKNPNWYPFKIIVDKNGNPQSFVDEDDDILRGLKDEWGDSVYDAVITAFKVLQNYYPSECYVEYELSTSRERVINCLMTQLNKLKAMST